jgi:hypothetical protein
MNLCPDWFPLLVGAYSSLLRVTDPSFAAKDIFKLCKTDSFWFGGSSWQNNRSKK